MIYGVSLFLILEANDMKREQEPNDQNGNNDHNNHNNQSNGPIAKRSRKDEDEIRLLIPSKVGFLKLCQIYENF